MSVVRVVRDRQYTVISNSPLQDTRLSLKARGLLAYCFSLPPDWRYSIEGLVKSIGRDGRDAVRGALKELESCGYLKRRRLHDARGKFTDTEYVIFETPQADTLVSDDAKADEISPIQSPNQEKQKLDLPALDNPALEKPRLEEPLLENPILVELQGFAPIADNPTLAKPPLAKPTLGNRLQQSTYIDKINKTTTTDKERVATLPEVCRMAKVCRVSEQTLIKIVKNFGAEKVAHYLGYMEKQQNIKNPNAWICRALLEQWEITADTFAAPRPDCPECGGKGYAVRGYIDASSGQEQRIRLKCDKCCGR